MHSVTGLSAKRELTIYLVLLAVMELFNLTGIILYQTQLIELVTQLPWAATYALGLYVVILAVRLLASLARGVMR